ncbi:MAG TPA: ABC transporter substrate-binding protein [Gaiellaceae bacterium]|jgi:putative spermidine/putrescine transport system substrate-binding protein
MSQAWKRRLGGVALSGLLVLLAFAAASCGGGGGGSSAEQISGLGNSLDDIKQKARDEGQVNLVIWSGYADPAWAKPFTQQTGCKVNTKDGASSDDMIDLINTGQYDGVSASGNASVRLMSRGDVAPINTDYIANYADVQEGIKNQSYNSKDDKPYGVPHGRGPNLLMFRTDAVPANTDSWAVIWDKSGPYNGKLSIYDDSIFIADAAVYLKATQPDLKIDNPYELDDKQFNAAINLLKKQAPEVSDYWPGDVAKQVQAFTNKDAVVGTTWPYQVNLLEDAKVPVKAVKPKEGTTGWSDTWMIYSKAEHPNCMYLWMNYIISPEAQAKVAESFGEAPVNPKACALTTDKQHCAKFHAEDESWWKDVYYWTTPTQNCGDDRGDVCKTQEDWKAAWTEIRG